MEIPPEYEPHPDQIPAFVMTDADLERWRLCFAITRAVAQRDDPVFARELYFGDLPTDVLMATISPPTPSAAERGSPATGQRESAPRQNSCRL